MQRQHLPRVPVTCSGLSALQCNRMRCTIYTTTNLKWLKRIEMPPTPAELAAARKKKKKIERKLGDDKDRDAPLQRGSSARLSLDFSTKRDFPKILLVTCCKQRINDLVEEA